MNISTLKALTVGLLATTAINATPAKAQDTEQNESQTQSDSRYSIDTITVTARRKEEGLQEAPLAITALSGIELENRGAVDVIDFADVAPNVAFKQGGTTSGFGAAPRISIRGIGQQDFVINTDPAVGIYTDGVYLGRSLGSVLDLVDVERVEALRGPQGTLFGRNNTGGSINIIAKKPEIGGQLNGYLSAAGGENGYLLLRGGVNIPLGDTLAARVTAMHRQRDGFIPALQYDDLDLGAENVTGVRAAVRWEPSENLTIDVDGDFSTRDDTAAPFIPVLIGDLGVNETNIDISGAGSQQRGLSTSVFARRFNREPFTPPIPADFEALGFTSAVADGCSDPAIRDTSPNCLGQFYAGSIDGSNQVWFDRDGNPVRPDDQRLDVYGFSGRISWSNENLTFKSITAVRGFDASFLNGSPAPVYIATNDNERFNVDQFSQEITLAGRFGDRLDWLIGGFYFQEDGVETVTTIFPLAPPVANFSRDFLPTAGVSDRFIDNESLGAFGQITFDIVPDTLSVTGGVRITNETKDVVISTLTVPVDIEVITELVGTTEITEPNFLASISWTPTDDLLIYGQFSDGFRSGGFPARVPPGTGLVFEEVSFDPEFVESFEIGAKTTLFNGAMRANIALFTSNFTDQQINATAFDPIFQGNVSTVANLGNSRIRGVELEANYLVTDNLRIDTSVGYLDAELREITTPDGQFILNEGTNLRTVITSEDRNTLPQAPEWQVNVGANYSFFLANGFEFRNRFDVLFESSQFSTIANYDFGLVPSTTRLNYFLTLIPDSNWEFTFGARNLTDEVDVINATFNTGPGAAGSNTFRRGRELFGQIKYSFGQ